jgi:hypothetical protein
MYKPAIFHYTGHTNSEIHTEICGKCERKKKQFGNRNCVGGDEKINRRDAEHEHVKKSDLIQETDGWLNDLAGYIKRIS